MKGCEKFFTPAERRAIRAAARYCSKSFCEQDSMGESLAETLGMDKSFLADDFGCTAVSPDFFNVLARERMLQRLCALAHDSGLGESEIHEVLEQYKGMTATT